MLLTHRAVGLGEALNSGGAHSRGVRFQMQPKKSGMRSASASSLSTHSKLPSFKLASCSFDIDQEPLSNRVNSCSAESAAVTYYDVFVSEREPGMMQLMFVRFASL